MENEEAIARSKDRHYFIKQAVSYRNAFAAAHSSYATCLKNAGAALTDFAQTDNQEFSPSSSSAVAQSSYDVPLPPPPPDFPAALRRAITMPETQPESEPVETIVEEEDEEEEVERRSRNNKQSVSVNLNLIQVLNDVDNHFLIASEAAREVSKLLQATRLHFHSNFSDDRGNENKKCMAIPFS